MKPLGDSFIKLVKMIIAPVIFLTVSTGIAGMTDMKKVGRVAGKAMIYFLCFSTLALIVGLIIGNLIQPGSGLHINPASLDAKAVQGFAAKAHDASVVGFLQNIIPDTIVGAFASGDILQVLFFSVLFGLALAMVGERGKPVLDFLQALSTPIFKLVAILMKAAPIGAFGAMAFTIGKYGLGSLLPLMKLIGTFYLTAIVFVLLVLGTIARIVGFNIVRFIGYIKEEMLIVLGTSSSEAALPQLMEKLEKLGCSRSVVGLVVPTGYSFNLDGTNIYMTMAVLFIAQATNTDLSWGQQLTLLAVTMLTSKGASGVTGAGFITLAATLAVVPTIPLSGMVLILGIDRFMSECRALTNIVGNGVATIVVSAWEKELDRAKLRSEMRRDVSVSEAAEV
jgi:aerobic C4-dicarboxylate transport protein